MSKPKISKLKSGLTVITESNPSAHSVLVSVGVKAGGRDETNTQTGIAHLLEHMAFKGTVTRTCDKIIHTIEDQGGQVNAYTGKTETVYYIRILKEKAEMAVDILGDIVQNSIFPQEELEKERQVVVQEIKSYEDSPEDVVYDNFYSNCFPNHPLGRSILGTEEQVMSYTREDLIKFVKMHYVPENMAVSISGNITHQKAIQLVKKYFVQEKKKYTHKRKTTKFKSGQLLINKADLNQTHVMIGFATCSNKDLKEVITGKVLSNIMGSGMSSRLFTEIREKRGLVYSVYSFSSHHEDVGIFGIVAGTDNKKLPELIYTTFELIKNAAATITQEELNKTKTKILSSMLIGSENTSGSATENMASYFSRGKIYPMLEIKRIIKSITLKDVQKRASKVFKTKPNIVVLGNEKLKKIPM